jgi:hypothetical protein
MDSFKSIGFFYMNYLRGFLQSDHSHSRAVLKSLEHSFPVDSIIGKKLKIIRDNQNGHLHDTTRDVSDLIAETIPLKYRVAYQAQEFIYNYGIVEHDKPTIIGYLFYEP